MSSLLPVETGEMNCKNRENSKFQTSEKQKPLKTVERKRFGGRLKLAGGRVSVRRSEKGESGRVEP